jgi:uncharacterized protein (DUF2267 family)
MVFSSMRNRGDLPLREPAHALERACRQTAAYRLLLVRFMKHSSLTRKHAEGSAIDVFDSTLQKTTVWLNEIMAGVGVDDPHVAYIALRSALHALRDRLTLAEATQLGAQLPMLVRGLYYEGWSPTRNPVKWNAAGFLAHIRDGFRGIVDVEPEIVARAVFRVLAKHISSGELDDVRAILPADIRTLFAP